MPNPDKPTPAHKNSPSNAMVLGCAPFGSQMALRDAFAMLDRYVELGGRTLDSAHIYGAWAPDGLSGGCGNSEAAIGQWLTHTGLRGDMSITTKGGHPDFHTKASGLTLPMIETHLSESVERLGTDYVDIYWLHRDDRDIPVAEILGWLEGPLNDGTIRQLGVSHWRPDRLLEANAYLQTHHNQSIHSQIAFSLARVDIPRRDGPFGEQLAMDSHTWHTHQRHKLPLMCYNAQAAGFFASKYDGVDFHAEDFPKPNLSKSFATVRNLALRDCAMQYAHAHNLTTNQVALAWLRQQPFPTQVIIGPSNLDQLEDSMGAQAISLDSQTVEQLTSIWLAHTY